MKILLITDQHFGVRNDNQHFINHYKKFYNEIVVPFIKASNIKHVIALGDTFDKRRSINFMSLNEAKEMWFNPLEEMGVRMHMLTGNHDLYYKNTLRINAPRELLGEYGNITVHDSPTTIDFGGLDILLLPWICDGNRDESLREIQTSSALVCMGHLELNGFEAHPGHVMENGMDKNIFSKFDRVFSGHYHMKSKKDNITYLGNRISYIGMIMDVREDSMCLILKLLRQLSTEIPLILFISCIIMMELLYQMQKNLKEPLSN